MFSKKSYIHMGNRLKDQLNKRVNEGNTGNHTDTHRKHGETKEPELGSNQ